MQKNAHFVLTFFEYTVKYTGAEIKDQGNYPFCVACALATVLEAWIQKIYGENIIISEIAKNV